MKKTELPGTTPLNRQENFRAKLEAIAAQNRRGSVLKTPIKIATDDGQIWYVRILKEVQSSPYHVVIFGAGTGDLSRPSNADAVIEIDLTLQSRPAKLSFPPLS